MKLDLLAIETKLLRRRHQLNNPLEYVVIAVAIVVMFLNNQSASAQGVKVPFVAKQNDSYVEYVIKFSSLEDKQRAVLDFKQRSGVRFIEPFISFSSKSNDNLLLSSNRFRYELGLYVKMRCASTSIASSTIATLQTQYKPTYLNQVQRIRLDGLQRSIQKEVTLAKSRTQSLQQSDEPWYLKNINGLDISNMPPNSVAPIIGFIDTGVDWEHPALVNHLWINTKEDINSNGTFEAWSSKEIRDGITGDLDGIDNDNNGFEDDVIGYNFVDQTIGNIDDYKIRDGIPYDDQGHGTSVAGVLGGSTKTARIGLATSSPLMTLKAFDITGNAEDDDIASAIIYAVENNCKVLNFSFGDIVKSPIVEDAIRYANSRGVVIVASSGNGGGLGIHYPSDYPEIISVGAVTKENTRAIFSSYNGMISLVAPGVGIQTTAVGGDYRSVNGTSFSAPLTAATCALLLQKNPSLSPESIRSILISTAVPLENSTQWQLRTGHGLLNVRNALESTTYGEAQIISPRPDAQFRRSANSKIPIFGIVSEPLMESFRIDVGIGERKDSMITISQGKLRPLTDTLGVLDISRFPDTTLMIHLFVRLRNNRVLSHSTRITIFGETINFTNVKVNSAWFNDKKVYVVSARSNIPSYMNCEVISNQTTKVRYDDVIRFGYNHTFVIEPEKLTDGMAKINVTASIVPTYDKDKSITNELQVDIRKSNAQGSGFKVLPYSAPRLFLNNYTTNYAGDKLRFIASDNSNQARRMGEYRLINDTTISRFTQTGITYFARGIGDANANGQPEIWAQSGGKSVLFEREGDNPFAKVLFADTAKGDFWACRMADIDGDNIPELFAYRKNRTQRFRADSIVQLSDRMEVWKFRNGTFFLLDTLENTTPPRRDLTINIFSSPGCAVADFDNDGRIECAFTDSDGDVSIFEWNGTRLENVAQIIDDSNAGAGTEFTLEADIDGDGKKELVVATPSNPSYNIDGEYDSPLWTLRVIRADVNNTYRELAREYFYGVRYDILFRNGLSAGNLNDTKGDEIICSFFPNLYVFTWNNNISTLINQWYSSDAWSNNPIVTDFNQNGKNELGFVKSSTLKTEFWERSWDDTTLESPRGLNARLIQNSNNEIKLYAYWDSVAKSKAYEVLFYDATDASTVNNQILAIVSDTFVLRDSFSWKVIGVIVRALEETSGSTATPFSKPAFVINTITTLQSATPKQTISNTEIVLKADGTFSDEVYQSSIFELKNTSSSSFPLSVIKLADNSLLLLYPRLSSGEYTLTFNGDLSDRNGNKIQSKSFSIVLSSEQPILTFHFTGIDSVSPSYVYANTNLPIKQSTLSNSAFMMSPVNEISTVEFANSERTRIKFTFKNQLSAKGYIYAINATSQLQSDNSISMDSNEGNSISWLYKSSTFDCSFTYPEPFSLSKDEVITFSCIPDLAEVHVMTIDGIVLTKLKENSGVGGVKWRPNEDNNVQLSSGVYLYKIVKNNGEESGLFKFVINR